MNPSLIQKYFFLPTRCSILQGAKNGEIEILHENENLTILLTMAWRLDGREGGRPEEMGGRPWSPTPGRILRTKPPLSKKSLIFNLFNFHLSKKL